MTATTLTTSTTAGPRQLADVARHLVLPSGIAGSRYLRIEPTLVKLGIEHDDWQRDLGMHALARRSSGLYAAGIGGVVLSTCRQIGKTFTFGSIIFALCIDEPKTTVLWTAHHSRTNDETYEALVEMARMPRMARYVKKIVAGNGKQSIQFTNGSRILFGAREHGFGRGIPGVTIVVFDEAQILSQRALNAMIPAANTVRNPLIIYMGTPPEPGNPSEVFAGRRRRALEVEELREAGQDASFDGLYVEISADQDADVNDRGQWAKGNPSYPARTPDEAFLRLIDQLGDEGSIRREGLGIWDDDNTAGRAISAPQWSATYAEPRPEVPEAELDPEVRYVPLDGRRALGVAFSLDGMRLSLAGALVPEDAIAHAELIDAYAGSMEMGLDPLADWMAERWRDYSGFVLSGRAGAAVLAELLRKRRVPERRVLVASTPIYLQSCAAYLNEIRAKTVTHARSEGQSALDEAVKVTTRRARSRVDGAWSWWSANGDHVHVEAVSLALYGARTLPPRKKPDPEKKTTRGRIL